MGVEEGVPVQNQSAGGFSLGGGGSAAPVACVTAATSTAHDRAGSALVGLASLLPLRKPPLRACFFVCLVALIMKALMFTPPSRSSPQWDILTRGPFGSGAHLRALAMDSFEDSSSDTQLSLLLLPTHLDRATDSFEDPSSDTQLSLLLLLTHLDRAVDAIKDSSSDTQLSLLLLPTHLERAVDAFEDSSSETQLSLLLLPTHLERAADSFKDSSDSQPWLCSCCRCTLHPDADSHCVCTRHSYERRRTRARPAHIKTLQQRKRQTTTGRNGRRRPRRRPDCAGPDCAFSFDFSMLPCSTASFLRPWAESMAKTSAAQVVNHQIFSWRENGSTRHAAGLLPLSYLR